ncbi:MAG: hypothetical protein ACYCW6_32375 [Candidatus Xenobia bacterium]
MKYAGRIYLRTSDREAVLKAVTCKAYVSPLTGGWVTVLPELAGQDRSVSQRVARRLMCPVLHVIRHGAWVGYVYYEAGKLVVEYESDPNYFQTATPARRRRLTGSPQRLEGLPYAGMSYETVQPGDSFTHLAGRRTAPTTGEPAAPAGETPSPGLTTPSN